MVDQINEFKFGLINLKILNSILSKMDAINFQRKVWFIVSDKCPFWNGKKMN